MFRPILSLSMVGCTTLVLLAMVTGRALPRGEQFLYSTSRSWSSGPWSITLVDVPRRIELSLVNRPLDARPGFPVVWSPDGTRISFATQVDEDTVETWLLDITESAAPRRLGDGHSRLEFGATWSPDGAHLAYVGETDGRRQVFLSSPTGDRRQQLTASAPGIKSAVWSPGGDWLALETDSSDEDIALLRLNSLDALQIHQQPGRDIHPVWSPDGAWIAFLSNRSTLERDPVYFDLFIMRPDGSGVRQLTDDHPALSNWLPSWSADGRWLSVAAWSWQGSDRITLVDTQSGRITSIMEPGITYSSPAWSPDDARLAFERRSGQFWSIWLYDLQTHVRAPLIEDGADSRRPLWIPDGQRLLFRSNRFGNWDIFLHSLTDASTRRLTTGHRREYAPAWRPCATTC